MNKTLFSEDKDFRQAYSYNLSSREGEADRDRQRQREGQSGIDRLIDVYLFIVKISKNNDLVTRVINLEFYVNLFFCH